MNIWKQISTFILACNFSTLALAQNDYDLTGDSLEIDVAHQGDIAVRIQTTRDQGKLDTLPKVEVIEEVGGFTCTVQSLSLTNEAKTEQGITETYRAVFRWEPGADVSGCVISISDPSLSRQKAVNLFMNY